MYLLPKSSVPPFKPLIVILISSITSFFCFHSLSYANFLRYYSHDASPGHILSYYYLLFLLKFKNLILISISCLYSYIKIFFFSLSLSFEANVFRFISCATCPLILFSWNHVFAIFFLSPREITTKSYQFHVKVIYNIQS